MSEPAEITIGGVDKTQYLSEGADLTGNARYTLQTGHRGEATVSIVVPDGDSYAPAIGQPINLFDFGVRKVAGIIANIREQWYESANARTYELTVASFERFFDKLLIPPRVYINKTAGFIVNDLVTFFSSEGITAGTIDAGATIPVVIYDHDNLVDALDNLARTSGFIWYIDAGFETLQFHAETTTAAPFTLVAQALAKSFQWNQTNQDFRDRQSIRINFDAFPPECDVFVGDGVTATATLGLIPAQVLAVINTTSTQNEFTITFNNNPANGEVYSISDLTPGQSYSISYTFVTILDNTIEFEVLIGADKNASAQNLAAAINATQDTAFRGVNYSWPTYTNGRARAYADNPAPGQVHIKSKVPGNNGNGVVGGSLSATFSTSTPTGAAVDGANQPLSIGRLNVDTQKDAYWDYGSETITFQIAPAAGQKFYVLYYPLGADVLTVENTFLRNTRASVEANSGIYWSIQDAANTTDPISTNASAGIQQAREMLLAYQILPETLTFSTYETGLAPGQLLTVTLATGDPFKALLDGTWLIRQVDAEYQPGYQWKYTAQAIAQRSSPPAGIPRVPEWVQFWNKLADTGPRRRITASTGAGGGLSQNTGVWEIVLDADGNGGLSADLVLNDQTFDLVVGQGEGGTLIGWDATPAGASTGADIICDILKNGTTVFTSTKIVIPAGSTATVSGAGFSAAAAYVPGDKFRGKVTQIGSTAPGKTVFINLYWRKQ